MWLQPIVLTIQIEAHKGFAIGVPLGKPLVIRNWIASLHAVCLTMCALATATLAMTDIKNKVAHAVRREAMIIIVITREWNDRSNPKYILCFFDNNVASAHCVNNSNRSTQGVETPCYKKLDCFASRCVPHGDDNNKNFQFDKFQRLFSVIYKKNSLTKEISK